MSNIITHILKTANQTITQRAVERDVEAERSMQATVAAFNGMHGTNLTEAQGWSFMVLLKMKRSFTGNGFRDDDFIDQAAYVALTAETREREAREFAERQAEALNQPSTVYQVDNPDKGHWYTS